MKRKAIDSFIVASLLLLIGICVVMIMLAISGCGPVFPVPPTPGPVEPADGGTADDCAAACANLARLYCPGWRGSPGPDEIIGTPDDVPCEQACRDIVTADPTVTLFQRCTAQAKSCAEVEACFDPS